MNSEPSPVIRIMGMDMDMGLAMGRGMAMEMNMGMEKGVGVERTTGTEKGVVMALDLGLRMEMANPKS
jgi:hypothetical protein